MIHRYFVSLILAFSVFTSILPPVGYAQTTATQTASQYAKGLATIEEKTEKRRQELGIPGMSLVIVKDGEIIFMKGFGYKDFEKKIPVTPDTQFGIGSASKAFTALSILMSADDGKVSLDDSPKKYLSYFKMKDPDADKNMTVRDLMAHTSGLNRTDLAMITNRLNRQELIQTVGEAQPMAKLREKFFYNNVMFAAAGEITAKVNNTTWEKYVPERIFKPLGMTNSTMTLPELKKAKDYSYGYTYNFDTKETDKQPFMDISATGPAGSINSSARDMAKWIAFVMNGGVVNGKRLVSEKGYDEWTKPQNKITPNGKMAYGLGWFLQEWNGMKVVQHGGNIAGFNSMVAMIPEKKLGFVMLTNVSASPLGGELMPIVWENILGKPEAPKSSPGEAGKETGTYRLEAAGVDIEIKSDNGKLVAVVPGQPAYTLENVGGRKFKFKEVEGFFVTFNSDSILLEQPQGSFTLNKIAASAPQKSDGSSAKELIGRYTPDGKNFVEIKGETDGKVTFNVEGQPPYTLVEKAKDTFNATPLPDSYLIKVKRDSANKVAAVIMVQPEGEFELKKADTAAENKPKISADELMKKAVEATGGEASWRKITSRVTIADFDAVHQGVKGMTTSYAKFPNKSATETTLTAVGKTIAKAWEYFDGTRGEQHYTFASVEKYTGKKLENVRLNADFYGLLNWKTNYKTVVVKGTEKVGDEECYVIEFTPEKGTKVTEFYSTRTFLLMKQNGLETSGTSDISLPYSITFSDYRDVDGIKLPFKIVNSNSSMGDFVTIVKSYKHNVKIDDKMFMPKKLVLK